VDGAVVAWFAELDEHAEEFCRTNWYGRWLTWRSEPPQLIPLTPTEYAEAQRRGKELHAKLRDALDAQPQPQPDATFYTEMVAKIEKAFGTQRQPEAVHEPDAKWCLVCNCEGHTTDECHSTHGLNTPRDREVARLSAKAQPQPEAQPAAWQPIETAPKRTKLLLAYRNQLGKWRRVQGEYWPSEELESDHSESGFADEGWYEATEAYEEMAPLEHDPTHWMPLPEPPVLAAQAKGAK